MHMSKWLVLLLAFPMAALAQETSAPQTPTQQTMTREQQENIARQQLHVQQEAQRHMVVNVDGSVTPGCPVGLFAQRSGTGTTVWTVAQEDAATWRPGDRSRAANVGVRVRVSAVHEHPFTQVDLSVAYMPVGTTYMPVGSRNTVETYLRKTFSLTAANVPVPVLVGNLRVGAAAGVTRVYVTHVVYADGTEWSESDEGHCSIVPSGYKLVDSAQ